MIWNVRRVPFLLALMLSEACAAAVLRTSEFKVEASAEGGLASEILFVK